jgi:septal ring factor EnvC (AmiA/AmiB activator)
MTAQCACIAAAVRMASVLLMQAAMEVRRHADLSDNKSASMVLDGIELAFMQAEGAALEAGRDEAHADLAHMHKQLTHTHKHIQELLQQITELESSKHKLEQESQEETLKLRQRLLTEIHVLHVRGCTALSPSVLLSAPKSGRGLLVL